MGDLKNKVVITPTYPTVGQEFIKWVVVEPGLFKYPLGEGEKPALLGGRCTKCGKIFFPKRSLCPDCFDDSFAEGTIESIALDSRGIIYASIVARVPSPVGIKHPYAYGYVDIPTNKIRVFALFTGAEPESFISGQEVELVLEPVAVNKQGQQVITYKFRPILERRY